MADPDGSGDESLGREAAGGAASADLEALGGRIEAARDRRRGRRGRGRAASQDAGGENEPTPASAGLRVGVDLVAGIAVGTGIGIVLDRWLGTSPWLLLVFFCLGCAAGFVNVMRTAAELDRKARARRNARDGKPAPHKDRP